MLRGGTSRGRGRGKGAAPVKPEDRDVQGYANKRVAQEGPPALVTNAATRGRGGRGRGVSRGRGDGTFGTRGRGRGGARAGAGGSSAPFGGNAVLDDGYASRDGPAPRNDFSRNRLGNSNGIGPLDSMSSRPGSSSASIGGSWTPRYSVPSGPRVRTSDWNGAGSSRERGISISSSSSGSQNGSTLANRNRNRDFERDRDRDRSGAVRHGEREDRNREGDRNGRIPKQRDVDRKWDRRSPWYERDRPCGSKGGRSPSPADVDQYRQPYSSGTSRSRPYSPSRPIYIDSSSVKPPRRSRSPSASTPRFRSRSRSRPRSISPHHRRPPLDSSRFSDTPGDVQFSGRSEYDYRPADTYRPDRTTLAPGRRSTTPPPFRKGNKEDGLNGGTPGNDAAHMASTSRIPLADDDQSSCPTPPTPKDPRTRPNVNGPPRESNAKPQPARIHLSSNSAAATSPMVPVRPQHVIFSSSSPDQPDFDAANSTPTASSVSITNTTSHVPGPSASDVPPLKPGYRPPTIPRLSDLPRPATPGPSRPAGAGMNSHATATGYTSAQASLVSTSTAPPIALVEVKKLTFKPKNPNKIAAQAATASSSGQIVAPAQPQNTAQSQTPAPQAAPHPDPRLQNPPTALMATSARSQPAESGGPTMDKQKQEEVTVKTEPGVAPLLATGLPPQATTTNQSSSRPNPVHVVPLLASTTPRPAVPAAQPAVTAEEVDIKPRIAELEDDIQVVEVAEEKRTSGTLAIRCVFTPPSSLIEVHETKLELFADVRYLGSIDNHSKRDIPSQCFSRDPVSKKNARVALRKQKILELDRLGRKIEKAHWRDDGVAFDWTLRNANKPAGPSPKMVKKKKTPATPAPGPPSVEPIAIAGAVRLPESVQPPEHANAATSEDTQTPIKAKLHDNASNTTPPTAGNSLSAQHAVSVGSAKNTALSVQKGRRGSTTSTVSVGPSAESIGSKLIPPPAIVDLPAQSAASVAPENDTAGRRGSTTSSTKNSSAPTAVASSLDPDDPSTWTDGYYTYRDLFAYPPGYAHWAPGERDEWVNRVHQIMNDPTPDGLATRFVRPKQQQNALAVLSKPKTPAQMSTSCVQQGGLIIIDNALIDVWSGLEKIATPHQARPNAPPPSNFLSALASHSASQTSGVTSPSGKERPKKEKKSKKRDRSELEVQIEAEPETASVSGASTSLADENAKTVDNNKKKAIDSSSKKSKKAKTSAHDTSSPVGPAISATDSATAPDPSISSSLSNPIVSVSIPATSTMANFMSDFDPRLSLLASQSATSSNIAPDTNPRSTPTPASTLDSGVLLNLNAELRQKVSEIERWTKILCEYPDMSNALGAQIERTQNEIFGLHDSISKEKRRLGL
ncbi:hypothetical protein I316_07944 [Kwoniella heveanensis BCC8398]|uniref:Uncharacterized protein n=1 Tax=Kwoniella heveanensis BCC8398 TaxID=1296120 RepID=A0A1B9GHD1_9TREE|nr:hypothetical protein I316_07944 [Kwoniella heveanensis BCC8398]